jgi:tetratricopeptide (TPR) repeat protein
MAKVYLRIYDREIESLIDQGHLDEAIAHCRHILKTFPKHLDTYRLLGKAYLEAKRHNEAMDIFSRVLMSVPDDFVSHVGMSIISDDEDKLDDAIWHMERAFESQPSNADIQGELQRLYGQRDGVEPPRIRMTRGALAHMYMQGELYPQAISEIRAVLNQDSQRADMQVLLARAFFHAGQKADASDICAQLLKRYPYCFDANRIMIELLHDNESAEDTKAYRHRVNELDPYSAFAQESIFRSDGVPDGSINLEHLEYRGQAVDLGQRWSSSIGIGLTTPKIADEQPEGIKAGLTDSISAVPLSASSQFSSEDKAETIQNKPEPITPDETSIPDFLRQAGWTESSETSKESEPSFESTPEPIPEPFSSTQSELTLADVPDWLKDKMPTEKAGLDSEPSSDLRDWLGGSVVFAPAEPADIQSEDNPDWLKGLGDSEDKRDEKGELESDKMVLLSLEPEQPNGKITTPTVDTLGTSEKEQEAALAWLETLAAKHGAKPEELITDPLARSEKPPEWVEQASALAPPQAPPSTTKPEEPLAELTSKPEIVPEDDTGIWLRNLAEKETLGEPAFGTTEEGAQLLSEEDTPEWLSGSQHEAATAETAAESSDVPDWLKSSRSEPPTEDTIAAEPVPELSSEEPPSEQTDMLVWMEGLDQQLPASNLSQAETPGSAYEQSAGSEQSQEPEGVIGIQSQGLTSMEPYTDTAPQEAALQEGETPLEDLKTTDAELPEWLRTMDQEEETAAPEISEKSDLPSWLQGDSEELPKAEPTSPSDWHPVESISESAATTERQQTTTAPERAHAAEGKTPPDDSALTHAQNEMKGGDIHAALEQYYQLIKKGYFIEETIRDLRDALYSYPVEVSIWQTLGDAYMRANRLQEALDAFNKAEELLR